MLNVLRTRNMGMPGWFSQVLSDSWFRLRFMGSSPTSGSALTVRSLRGILCYSFSLCSSPLALSSSLKINKLKNILKKKTTRNVSQRGCTFRSMIVQVDIYASEFSLRSQINPFIFNALAWSCSKIPRNSFIFYPWFTFFFSFTDPEM